MKLIIISPRFYSPKDEDAFFNWLESISAIKSIDGAGKELHITFKSKKISDKGLRDLIGLFYRYKIDMKQLQQFENDSNMSWFKQPIKYWYEGVFGSISK